MSTPGPLERATPAGGGQYRHTGEGRYPENAENTGFHFLTLCFFIF
jgi:hypothetical protein